MPNGYECDGENKKSVKNFAKVIDLHNEQAYVAPNEGPQARKEDKMPVTFGKNTTEIPLNANHILRRANEAGVAAGIAIRPRPMVVTQVGLDDKPLPGTVSEIVYDGLCGFAWVLIKPARGPFVNYLKSIGIGDRGVYGGWSIWVSHFDQSYERKYAYAVAFADVLREHGIEAFAGGRLD